MLILSIAFSSALAIAKVMFVIGCGALMAKQKILTSTMSSQLGTLVFTICVPCMLFVQIGESLTIQTLIQMSVVICYAIINMVFGFVSGTICFWVFEMISKITDVFTPKIKKTTNKITKKKEKDPTVTQTLTNGKVVMKDIKNEIEMEEEIIEGEIKIEIESNNEKEEENNNENNNNNNNNEAELLEKGFSNFSPMIEENEPSKQITEEEAKMTDRSAVRRTILVACTFGNAASMALGLIGSLYPPDRRDDLQLAISYVSVYMSISQSLMYSVGYVFLARGNQETELKALDENGQRIEDTTPKARQIATKLLKLLKLFASPPSIAVIIASIVALTPFLKELFFDIVQDGHVKTMFPNYPAISPPLGFVSSAMEMIGNAAIPCITMVLGANLVNGAKSKDVRRMDIATVTFSKLFISPIFGIISTFIGYKLNIITNDVMWLVLLLETATPPAQSLIVLFGKVGNGEKQLSTILFYTYLLSIVFMTVFLCIFFLMIDGFVDI